jgi:uncharacterized protein DUF4404
MIMADRLDKLRALLSELEAELRSLGSLDDEARQQLAAAATEIADSLRHGQRTEATRQAEDSLQDRLVDFEASHPQLAGLITRLIDGLGQLGI